MKLESFVGTMLMLAVTSPTALWAQSIQPLQGQSAEQMNKDMASHCENSRSRHPSRPSFNARFSVNRAPLGTSSRRYATF
jgi:hypothetical protein